MKALERIFLYLVLALLVSYVFLVDGNVESQVAIQEEIRARRIVIVNDAGQEVVKLLANDENNGVVVINNKNSNLIAIMGASNDGNEVMGLCNKDENPVASMGANKNDNGEIRVYNKDGKGIGSLP